MPLLPILRFPDPRLKKLAAPVRNIDENIRRLARDMAETMYEACRNLCLKTLWLKDNHLPHTAEAAMCKWWAPKLACEIIQQCLIAHGHGGYSNDLPFGQRYRDVLGLQIGDGTANIMKMIIARQKVAQYRI